jgi:hypothetical protein
VPANYIVFKPLGEVDPSREKPVTVTYLVNPNSFCDGILANYRRDTTDNVIIPTPPAVRRWHSPTARPVAEPARCYRAYGYIRPQLREKTARR